MADKASNLKVQRQSGTDRTLYATWSWSKSHTSGYTIQWQYATGDGVWFDGQTSTVTLKNALYSPSDNAKKVRARVKPVSTTHKVNKKDTNWWTASWTSWVTYKFAKDNTPPVPSAPTVSTKSTGNNSDIFMLLTAQIEATDSLTKAAYFELIGANGQSLKTQFAVRVRERITVQFDITYGGTYRVRAKSVWFPASALSTAQQFASLGISPGKGNAFIDTEESAWGRYSEDVIAPPSILGLTDIKCVAESETAARISWKNSNNNGIVGVEIESTLDPKYFDSSPENVSTHTVDRVTNYAIITGLETGKEWFFRMAFTNDAGKSGWSQIISTVLGTVPNPPTTWMDKSTVAMGETNVLHFIHNSKDGSKMSNGKIKLRATGRYISDPFEKEIDIPSSEKNEETGIYSFVFDTNSTMNPAQVWMDADITWSVRTKGIVNKYSDPSVERTFSIFRKPYVNLLMYDEYKWKWNPFNFEKDTIYTAEADFSGVHRGPQVEVTKFPIYIVGTVSPTSQTPIDCIFSIYAMESYETTDYTGEDTWVNAGDLIYKKESNLPDDLYAENASNDLRYFLFPSEVHLENGMTYRCEFTAMMNTGLSETAQLILNMNLETITYDLNAEIAYDSRTISTQIMPYCTDEFGNMVDNVTLSIFRRNFDGKFVELGSGLRNLSQTSVLDPHPPLDYARYRIVAVEFTNGTVFYEDLPAYPIPEVGIIIQWDEKWSQFEGSNPDELAEPPWTGSLLRLPYNISVSDSAKPDVELINYIGRDHPVSYYGTQVGQTATWSIDFERSDMETLYALRRLSRYLGDCYVREPNGSGYWANISISMNIENKAVAIPVTFTVTRVEGGT